MRSMYEQGASLERVGDKFGYTAGTVRKHLIVLGVVMRATHSRGTVPQETLPMQARPRTRVEGGGR